MANPETCVFCKTHNDDRPMAYRGDPWCSDNCHKRVAAMLELPQAEVTALRYWEAHALATPGKRTFTTRLKKELYRLVRESHEASARRIFGVEGQAVSGSTARPADRS